MIGGLDLPLYRLARSPYAKSWLSVVKHLKTLPCPAGMFRPRGRLLDLLPHRPQLQRPLTEPGSRPLVERASATITNPAFALRPFGKGSLPRAPSTDAISHIRRRTIPPYEKRIVAVRSGRLRRSPAIGSLGGFSAEFRFGDEAPLAVYRAETASMSCSRAQMHDPRPSRIHFENRRWKPRKELLTRLFRLAEPDVGTL